MQWFPHASALLRPTQFSKVLLHVYDHCVILRVEKLKRLMKSSGRVVIHRAETALTAEYYPVGVSGGGLLDPTVPSMRL